MEFRTERRTLDFSHTCVCVFVFVFVCVCVCVNLHVASHEENCAFVQASASGTCV